MIPGKPLPSAQTYSFPGPRAASCGGYQPGSAGHTAGPKTTASSWSPQGAPGGQSPRAHGSRGLHKGSPLLPKPVPATFLRVNVRILVSRSDSPPSLLRCVTKRPGVGGGADHRHPRSKPAGDSSLPHSSLPSRTFHEDPARETLGTCSRNSQEVAGDVPPREVPQSSPTSPSASPAGAPGAARELLGEGAPGGRRIPQGAAGTTSRPSRLLAAQETLSRHLRAHSYRLLCILLPGEPVWPGERVDTKSHPVSLTRGPHGLTQAGALTSWTSSKDASTNAHGPCSHKQGWLSPGVLSQGHTRVPSLRQHAQRFSNDSRDTVARRARVPWGSLCQDATAEMPRAN